VTCLLCVFGSRNVEGLRMSLEEYRQFAYAVLLVWPRLPFLTIL
jgi:hypothetical protein